MVTIFVSRNLILLAFFAYYCLGLLILLLCLIVKMDALSVCMRHVARIYYLRLKDLAVVEVAVHIRRKLRVKWGLLLHNISVVLLLGLSYLLLRNCHISLASWKCLLLVDLLEPVFVDRSHLKLLIWARLRGAFFVGLGVQLTQGIYLIIKVVQNVFWHPIETIDIAQNILELLDNL